MKKRIIFLGLLLTINNTFSATLKNEKKRIDDFVSAIELYLNGDSSAEDKSIEMAQNYSNEDQTFDSPAAILSDYLLPTNDTITDDLLFATFEDYDNFRACYAMVLFVGNVSRGKLDKFNLQNLLENYKFHKKGIGDANIAKLDKYIPLIEKWINSGFQYSEDLPKLLISKSKSVETTNVEGGIFELTKEELSKLRKDLKRPKLKGFYCKDDEVQKYLNTIKFDNIKNAEKTRIQYVKEAKDYVVRGLGRSPFSGTIDLISGSVSGTIRWANDENMNVKKSKRGKGKDVKWVDVSYKGLATILCYFADRQLKSDGGKVTIEERKANSARSLFLAAVVSDFGGDYAEAIRYIKKAINLNPKTKGKFTSVFLK